VRAAIAVGASTEAIGVSARVTLDSDGFEVATDGLVAGAAGVDRVALFPLPRPRKATMAPTIRRAMAPAAISRVRFVTSSPG
jgi:hypothetical protein